MLPFMGSSAAQQYGGRDTDAGKINLSCEPAKRVGCKAGIIIFPRTEKYDSLEKT